MRHLRVIILFLESIKKKDRDVIGNLIGCCYSRLISFSTHFSRLKFFPMIDYSISYRFPVDYPMKTGCRPVVERCAVNS
jgi:hypothetical protein